MVSNFLNYNYICRAANEKWGDSIREYQCVDVSQDMINVAQYLLKGINHFVDRNGRAPMVQSF